VESLTRGLSSGIATVAVVLHLMLLLQLLLVLVSGFHYDCLAQATFDFLIVAKCGTRQTLSFQPDKMLLLQLMLQQQHQQQLLF